MTWTLHAQRSSSGALPTTTMPAQVCYIFYKNNVRISAYKGAGLVTQVQRPDSNGLKTEETTPKRSTAHYWVRLRLHIISAVLLGQRVCEWILVWLSVCARLLLGSDGRHRRGQRHHTRHGCAVHIYDQCHHCRRINVCTDRRFGGHCAVEHRHAESQRRRRMDAVREYLRQRDISEELTEKVLNYYDYCYTRHISQHDEQILEDIHSALKEKLDLEMNQQLLQKVPRFKQLPEALLLILIHSLISRIYLPNELVYMIGERASVEWDGSVSRARECESRKYERTTPKRRRAVHGLMTDAHLCIYYFIFHCDLCLFISFCI